MLPTLLITRIYPIGMKEFDSFHLCLSSVYNHSSTRWDFMALKETEAIVIRTYPLREADLLVTLFTRAEGKVRGVARSAKKSKRRFGGALEPMTYVRAFYEVRERQELSGWMRAKCWSLRWPQKSVTRARWRWRTWLNCLTSCCPIAKPMTPFFA